jgi:hypothetical protein
MAAEASYSMPSDGSVLSQFYHGGVGCETIWAKSGGSRRAGKSVADAPMVLKKGERTYWVEQCRLYEERSLREIGLQRGRLEVDAGTLLLTDQRIVLIGAKRTIEIPLSKVVAIKGFAGSDTFSVSVANGKTRVLRTDTPRAAVVASRLLAGTESLSATETEAHRAIAIAPSSEVPIYMT